MYMGNALFTGAHFRSQAREHLKKLAEATGETAELDVRIRDQLVLIDQVTGPSAVYLYSHPGSAIPYFHATAPGKIYLAHLEKEKVRNIMKNLGFPKLTPHTIQDLDQLEKEIEKVKIDGYAVDIEEMREGVGRVAAPVYDESNGIMACIAIVCPAFKLKEQNKTYEYGQCVKRIASDISEHKRRIF
jgi:IclR family acetate operon transcriptional repressor